MIRFRFNVFKKEIFNGKCEVIKGSHFITLSKNFKK